MLHQPGRGVRGAIGVRWVGGVHRVREANQPPWQEMNVGRPGQR